MSPKKKILKRKLIRYTEIDGVEYPVDRVLYEETDEDGDVRFTVYFGLCRGKAVSARTYTSRQRAEMEFDGVDRPA